MEPVEKRIVIARPGHLAEEPVQRLAATSAKDHDDERSVFRRCRLMNFFEHHAADSFLGRKHFVSDISRRQLREMVNFRRTMREPDVSSYRTPSNRLLSGCRHFGITNFAKDARL
jgi:hypothetical protein